MEGQIKWNESVTTTVSSMSSTSLLVWLTSTTTSNTSVDSVDDNSDSNVYNWSFICVMVFVVAGTVGNVLVCLAVWLERPLQNVTNWFLVSLAFADLIVSTIVMPFGATAGFLGYWPLGVTWCNVYVTCDVLACSASILHMCCISLGRYLGIRSPLKARGYGGRGGGSSSFLTGGSSKRLVVVRVVLVWLLALLISSPISALGLIDPSNIMIGNQCVINNRGFAFFGSLAAFYIPMIIMVVSYALTVHLLRNKARQHQQQLMSRVGGSGSSNYTAGGRFAGNKRSFHSVNFNDDEHKAVNEDAPLQQERGTQTPVNVSRERRRLIWKERISFSPSSCQCSLAARTTADDEQAEQPIRIIKASASTASSMASRGRKVGSTTPRRSGSIVSSSTPNISSAATVANEQKASKVLGVVFFTFVLCWAPFFLLNLLMAVWPACSAYIPDRLVATCLWLGYVSSTINPLIYTVFNRTFKRVFIRLLKCQCRKSPTSILAASASATTVATVQHRYSRCASVCEGLANQQLQQQQQSVLPPSANRYR